MGLKIKKHVSVSSGIVAGVLLLLMFVVATLQMFSARFFVLDFNFAYAIRCLMIWSFMLGAVYCFGKGKHIAFTLLLNKFQKNKFHLILELIINILILFFIILVFLFGGLLAYSKEQAILLVYSVLPVSAILISLIVVIDLIEIIKKFGKGEF